MSFQISTLVKNKLANFSHYRQGYLYYNIEVYTGPEDANPQPAIYTTYSFPIEISDLGGATVSTTEKAITLMRYIRKALDNETFVRVSR